MKTCYSLVFSFAVVACTNEAETDINKFPDPYLDAIMESGARYILTYDEMDSLDVDTAFHILDENTIIKSESYSLEQIEYDSLNFKIHILNESDVRSNYVVNYVRNGNVIYEEWYPLNHLNWNYLESDIGSKIDEKKYMINEHGNVTEEITTTETIRYYYDNSNEHLIKKLFSHQGEKQVWSVFKYDYWDNGNIKQITIQDHGTVVTIHLYNEKGILRYTLHNKIDISYKQYYKYVY